MLYILVTLDVLKLLKSRLVSPQQAPNMEFMLVTLDVLKWLKSRLVSFLQFVNIQDILVTSLVFRCSMPVMDSRLFME